MKINETYLKRIINDDDYENISDVVSAMLNECDNGSYIADFERVKEFLECYKIAKTFESYNPDVKVTHEIFSPFKDTAIITIICKSIIFNSASDIIRISKKASTLGVSPRIDGYIEVAFSFVNMSKKVG